RGNGGPATVDARPLRTSIEREPSRRARIVSTGQVKWRPRRGVRAPESLRPYNERIRANGPKGAATMATATATSPGKMYIDGKWVGASGGQTLAVINPATEETIREVAYGTREDARRAVEAAARAMPAWMKLTAYDRAKVLKK